MNLEKFQVDDIKYREIMDPEVVQVVALIALLMIALIVLLAKGAVVAPIAAVLLFLMNHFFDDDGTS